MMEMQGARAMQAFFSGCEKVSELALECLARSTGDGPHLGTGTEFPALDLGGLGIWQYAAAP